MRHISPLPDELGDSFTVSRAIAAGATAKRMRSPDLASPFHGVRMRADADPVEPIVALACAFAEKMTEHEFFSHATAAALWGLPLPAAVRPSDAVDVAVFTPRRNPRGRGIRGHEVEPALAVVTRHPSLGLPIADPASTWAMLGGVIAHPYDLVALGDAIVRTPQHRHDPPALATIDDLEAAVRAGRRVGRPALRNALPRVRAGSSSVKETHTRLVLVEHGLPEPELAWEVRNADGVVWARLDLAYPCHRVAIEYEGEQHLTDPAQWAKDIARYERLATAGWTVIRVTKGDLGRPALLAARVRAALAARS